MQKDSTGLLGIDVDYEDFSLIRCVERALGQIVPTKKGKKGATFFCRLDRQFKSISFKWIREGLKVNAVDILAGGRQTVIPPSIHPDTKLPYGPEQSRARHLKSGV